MHLALVAFTDGFVQTLRGIEYVLPRDVVVYLKLLPRDVVVHLKLLPRDVVVHLKLVAMFGSRKVSSRLAGVSQ